MQKDPLRKVLEYIWPELTDVYGQPFADFLKAHQADWDDIFSYDELYQKLVRGEGGSLHGHTGAPTPIMRKHASGYGLHWEDGVVYSPKYPRPS